MSLTSLLAAAALTAGLAVFALVTFGAAARTAVGAVLALDFFAVAANAAFAGDVTAFTAVAATLPMGLAAVVFLVTDRVTGVDLLAGLMAGLIFFAEGVGVFAVFFIAFAIESKPSELPHRANQTMYFMHRVSISAKTRFARATFLNLSAPAFNFVHAIAYLL
jgi:hypothetical protein